MTTTTTAADTPCGLATSDQWIVLRISVAGEQDSVREFKSEKITVGSSGRCDVQITKPGVQPLHCVLARKASGAQLTSWAEGVCLNEQPVKAAELHPGDVLSLADVQIEYQRMPQEQAAPAESSNPVDGQVNWDDSTTWQELEAVIASDAPAAPEGSEAEPEQLAEPVDARAAESQAFSDRLVLQATAANLAARKRCRQLIQGFRATRSRAEELSGTIADLESKLTEAERLRDENLQHEAASDARIVELNRELEEVQRELEEVRTELHRQAEEHEQLQAAHAALQNERDALANSTADNQCQQAELSQVLAERDNQLEEVRVALEAANEALAKSELQLTERDEQWQTLHSQLEEKNAEIEQVRQQLESARDSDDQLDAMQSRCEALQSQLSTSEQEISRLREKAAERDFEIATLSGHAKEWNLERDGYLSQLAEGRGALERLTAQLNAAQEKDNQAIVDLESQKQLLQDELRDAQTELQSLQSQYEERMAETVELRRQGDDWQSEKTGFETKLSEQNDLIAALREAADSAIARNEAASEQKERERDQLAENLAAARRELDRLGDLSQQQEEELAALREAGPSQATHTDAQLDVVVQRLEHLAEELEATRKRCQEAESRAEELQQKHDVAIQELQQTREPQETSLAADFSEEAPQLLELTQPELPHLEEPLPVELLSEEQPSEEEFSGETEEAAECSNEEEKIEGASVEEQRDSANDFFAAPAEREKSALPTTSFIEQYSHLLDESGEPSGSEQSVTTPQHAIEEQPVPSLSELAAGDNEEDVLQAYMANMMSRVRGKDGPALNQSDMPACRPEPVQQQTAIAEPESEAQPLEPMNLEQLGQTTSKRPLTSDISALRDLANSSARKAIATSRKRRHFEMAVSKLIICAIALGTAGYLMLDAESYTSITFLGGSIAAIAGIYSGLQLLGCLLRAIRDGSWEGEHSEPTIVQTLDLPIDSATRAS